MSYPPPRYLGETRELSAASRPSPRFHRLISESFFILSGSVRIYDGRRWIDTEPGDFVYVPEGGVHAFRNESGAPAEILLHFAPGAPREAYFEGLPDGRAGRLHARARHLLAVTPRVSPPESGLSSWPLRHPARRDWSPLGNFETPLAERMVRRPVLGTGSDRNPHDLDRLARRFR
ncbi:cupin domain-containing protein [Dactylosporangium sp. NPDC051484]|uniref:cupin domain-containing protein n=1 Tax=Dactylosporangium sp. NPDC051484 TaxID=3154942 RepID=UPI00344F8D18